MELYGQLPIVLAPMAWAYPGPVCLQILSLVLFHIAGKLNPTSCNFQAPITVDFSLGLAKRRPIEYLRVNQGKSQDTPFPAVLSEQHFALWLCDSDFF